MSTWLTRDHQVQQSAAAELPSHKGKHGKRMQQMCISMWATDLSGLVAFAAVLTKPDDPLRFTKPDDSLGLTKSDDPQDSARCKVSSLLYCWVTVTSAIATRGAVLLQFPRGHFRGRHYHEHRQ